MTSRERLLTALRGDKPDRIPVTVRGVYPYNETWLERCRPSFRPLADLVREHCDQYELAGFDHGFCLSNTSDVPHRVESIPFSNGRTVETRTLITPRGALSMQTTYTAGQPPMATKFWVESDEDLDRFLSIPYVPIRPDHSVWRKQEEALGERGLAFFDICTAAAHVHELLGTERLAIWSATRRDDLHRLLKLVNDRIIEFIDRLLEVPVGQVVGFTGDEYITPPIHGPKDFADFVTRYNKPLIELIHARGRLVRSHCHGRLKAVLDGFLEMGVDALHPVECLPMGDITIEEFRQKVGRRICVKGNIQIGDLIGGRPEEIRRDVRHTMDAAGRDGALILCPSASPYVQEVTPEVVANYRAYIEAAEEGR